MARSSISISKLIWAWLPRGRHRRRGAIRAETKSSASRWLRPTTAHARVKDMYLPKRFVNELSFIKIDGRWQIIAKVWHFFA
jgi:hypothetical protein